MVIHYACPVCQNSDISHYLECPDHFLTKEVFNIYKCNKCGFLFTHEHPGEADAGKYYESDDYISHSNTSRSITEKAYQIVRQFMLRRKVRLIKRFTGLSQGRLLDIGCGTGHFLYAMKQDGWEVEGIEKSPKARSFAESEFGLSVIDTSQIAAHKDNSFDCITLWHVLEHFNDPEMIMKEIRRLLKPDGICVIALPNSDSEDAKYYGKFWAAFDVPRHLWHFNPQSFSKFANKQSFRIKKIRQLPFDVFYISILSEKYKGSVWPALTGFIMAELFSLGIIFNKLRSSSLIYIMKKTVN
jgi:2-polyprenyl-3-methyl-5-hydroxy-6-metoxy-1,4-benzoquinol methylase